jgi:hypothetical protein
MCASHMAESLQVDTRPWLCSPDAKWQAATFSEVCARFPTLRIKSEV